jgi:hypothetical protein
MVKLKKILTEALSELQTGDTIGTSLFNPGKINFKKVEKAAQQRHGDRYQTIKTDHGSGGADPKHKYFEIQSATEKVNGKPKIYCFQLSTDNQMKNVVRVSIATPDSGAGSFPHNMGMYVSKAAEEIYNTQKGKMWDFESLSEADAIEFINKLK